jgi:biopolymer transport protein ExbD
MRPMTFSTPRGYPGPKPEEQPISTPNTTPLIDVMLVLLIMMILAIPAMKHTLPVELATSGANIGAPPPVHELAIAANGALSFDGRSVERTALAPQLRQLVADPARPVLHLRTDANTRYDLFHETMGVIKAAGITRVGFVGNDAMRSAI